jgi:hypothetical protein
MANSRWGRAGGGAQIQNGRFKMGQGRRLIANSKWQIQDGPGHLADKTAQKLKKCPIGQILSPVHGTSVNYSP